MFYAALAASALICIFAKPIVEILYGIKYIPAIEPLRIIVWYTAFSYLGVARNPWMVCENKQKYLKYIYIGAAVINVLLNALLIPNFGAAGAAGASLGNDGGFALCYSGASPKRKAYGRGSVS